MNRAVVVAVVSVSLCAGSVSTAAAAPVRSCSYAEGGGFKNITTRKVSCRRAVRVVKRVAHDITPCYLTELSLGTCRFRRGAWSVRGRWFKDGYGNSQLDLRSTASGGRVVRFQTDYDGE